MSQRKLGRPADQRKAMLRGLVTQFIWHGRIETTLDRAKEVRSIAEKYITLAARECDNNVTVSKTVQNKMGQTTVVEVQNDQPSKLAARRAMLAYLYALPHPRKDDESRTEFRERTGDNKFPVIEKLMREIGPKYKKRAEEKGQWGGYTRILKLGPRRGDGAEMVILELV